MTPGGAILRPFAVSGRTLQDPSGRHYIRRDTDAFQRKTPGAIQSPQLSTSGSKVRPNGGMKKYVFCCGPGTEPAFSRERGLVLIFYKKYKYKNTLPLRTGGEIR